MTFAFRATQKSIDRNYERAWDWSGSCGQAAHVFADVYTSLRLTFQVYGLGTVVVDNFWELGVEHVYAFVVSSTHMKVYRDGNEMGALAVNGGISNSVRDQFYIGGSSCDCDQNVCSSNVHRWHANVKWFRVWKEALTDTRIQDLNNFWKKTPCTLAETTFTIDETIDGNAGAMSYFAIVNVTSRMNHVFQQNSGTCSYKELWFGVHPSTRKLYVGMCGVGTSETVAALPDGVNAIAMKYHAYGELEIWANGAKLDLGISQINGRAFSSSSTFQSSCSDQIKVYNRALSQNELETMTALTSETESPTVEPTTEPTQEPSLSPTIEPSLKPSSSPTIEPTKCTVKYTRHRGMIRQGNWFLSDDDLIPTDPVCVRNDDWTPPFCRDGKFPQSLAIGIDRCKVACAARPKCKAIGIGHPTRGTAAECWLAGEVNDQDNPLMVHGHWDFYDIEEVCDPATESPTVEPTNEPTLEPSLSPTIEPTLEPSLSPTSEPSLKPSSSPTIEPTRDVCTLGTMTAGGIG